jgi:predicted dinucleotide-binding enzyme
MFNAKTYSAARPNSPLAAELVRDAGFDPVDSGPLRVARYTEPFALLVGQLAYEGGGGPELAYRFERFGR